MRANLHYARQLLAVRPGRYDIVQAKDLFLGAVMALLTARTRGARFVYWLSYPFPEASLYKARTGFARYPILYRIRGWAQSFLLYRIIMTSAEHVYVQSEQMKRDIVAKGVAAAKLTAVPMGVPDTDLDTAKRVVPVDLPDGTRTVVYIGTLANSRRIDFVVRAFARVVGRFPEARLYLVGDGGRPEDTEMLRQEAGRLGINHAMTITGQLPRPEALAYVQAADVCLSPFYPTPILESTSPTKLVEYMAFRKPVVATEHPEQRLVVSESGAGYCVPFEEAPFADAIISLLERPEEAAAMGERGFEYVRKHRCYSVIGDRVREVYDELTSRVGNQ
jgi:glycosyltransferase involved in cell wall biosynthesis